MTKTVFFGGTAYLSIPTHEEFRQLFLEGVGKYGTNYGASRNNPTVPDIYQLAENEAATRFSAGDAIIVSSGYLAAQLVLQQYSTTKRLIYAPDTHPALWIGKPNTPQVSFSEWVKETLTDLKHSTDPVLIVSNSFNNLVPEQYGFGWLEEISTKRDITLLIDDSHGLGVTGAKGKGIYSGLAKDKNRKTIIIGSMAKALGIDAGLILGDESTIRELRSSPVYAGASPPSPAFMFAFCHAGEIYREQLSALKANMQYFFAKVSGLPGVHFLPEIPVVLVEHPDAGEKLRSMGFEISFFPYPDPEGLPLNRIVVTSSHQKSDLDRLSEALKNLG